MTQQHRVAIGEARKRARVLHAERAREHRHQVKIFAGSGLCSVVFGAIMGAYLAYGGFGESAASSSVAIALVDDGGANTVAVIAAAQIPLDSGQDVVLTLQPAGERDADRESAPGRIAVSLPVVPMVPSVAQVVQDLDAENPAVAMISKVVQVAPVVDLDDAVEVAQGRVTIEIATETPAEPSVAGETADVTEALAVAETGETTDVSNSAVTVDLAAASQAGDMAQTEEAAQAEDRVQSGEAAEAAEAELSRLYEQPLETAASPALDRTPGVESAEIQQAALPVPDLPLTKGSGVPAWQRFAVPVANSGGRPMIAIVLDDLGLNRVGTRRAISLPGPLTLAFMTYAQGLERMATDARAAGHELMLHVPMQPRDPSYDPGRNVLRDDLPDDELARRIDWALGRFEGFVGINNHMGSRFTTSPRGMAQVMRAIRARGYLFLDSVTSSSSVGAAMANRAGVPYAERDVFLDNEWNDRAAIARQFVRLEAVARRYGSAIAIGHPHRATLDVLARWLPEARARGFAIVPVSAIVRHRLGIGQQLVETTG